MCPVMYVVSKLVLYYLPLLWWVKERGGGVRWFLKNIQAPITFAIFKVIGSIILFAFVYILTLIVLVLYSTRHFPHYNWLLLNKFIILIYPIYNTVSYYTLITDTNTDKCFYCPLWCLHCKIHI